MTFAQNITQDLLLPALSIYTFVIFANVILSWLIVFNIVNTQNQIVAMVVRVTQTLTEPVLRPIRRFMPNLGGIDLSPIILLLLVYFLSAVIRTQICPMLGPVQYCY